MRPVFVFDLDGTLANCEKRLHLIQQGSKEWDQFYAECINDEPIQDVIDVAKLLNGQSHPRFVYMTGRPDTVRDQTRAWLAKHELPHGDLYMRRAGDHRPDTEAKREMMELLLRGCGKVLGVFEDRPSVCRVWREMGLTVFQVNDKEF